MLQKITADINVYDIYVSFGCSAAGFKVEGPALKFYITFPIYKVHGITLHTHIDVYAFLHKTLSPTKLESLVGNDRADSSVF